MCLWLLCMYVLLHTLVLQYYIIHTIRPFFMIRRFYLFRRLWGKISGKKCIKNESVDFLGFFPVKFASKFPKKAKSPDHKKWPLLFHKYRSWENWGILHVYDASSSSSSRRQRSINQNGANISKMVWNGRKSKDVRRICRLQDRHYIHYISSRRIVNTITLDT